MFTSSSFTMASARPSQTLLDAARKGNSAELERQISEGEDVSHGALIHAAADRGHVKVLNLLLSAGADKDAASVFGYTPLHTAANRGQVKAVQALIEAGADKDKVAGDQTPLSCAVRAKHVNVVKVLLEAGADTEVLCDGKTALDISRKLKCKSIVTLLEKRALKLTGKKAAEEEPENPPRGKAAKTSASGPSGQQDKADADATTAKRFTPPSVPGGDHYEISEDGRRAIGKGSDSAWTALGGVLAIGEAVAFKFISNKAMGLVGLAPATSCDEVWQCYGLEGQASIAEVRGGIGLSNLGNLKINQSQGPRDLCTFGEGDVIELRRLSERLFRWSKDGEVVIEHEAPAMHLDSLCWCVTGYCPNETRTAVWEIAEVGVGTMAGGL